MLDQPTKQAFYDWRIILRAAATRPTSCTNLVPAPADYLGYCDASKHGAGGVWFGGTRALPPVVWQVAFPAAIQAALVSEANPTGSLTNSDLEMAGLLLHWLTLEQVADLKHTHVAAGCDNSPTVAWASRLLSSKAKVAAHLLCILAIRMLARQASPLTTYHLPGVVNTMADEASRSFIMHPLDAVFLTMFNSSFPLPQGDSWLLCRLPSKLCGKIYLALLTTTSPLAWWLRTTNSATVIGVTGVPLSQPMSIHSYKTLHASSNS